MDVADLFDNEVGRAHFLHRWSRHAPNPYQAFLRLADDFIVTNDSASMIAEAVDMMKPLLRLRGSPPREAPQHGSAPDRAALFPQPAREPA